MKWFSAVSRFMGDVASLRMVLMVGLLAAAEACWAVPCPTDQDPGDDLGNDACFELQKFIVPKVPAIQDKSSPGGWGALVLTFDREIDGGSFIFNTDCPDPLDGILSADKKSILLKPAGIYKIVATGGPATKDKTKTAETFDVTILYDVDAGLPIVEFGYWKAKMTDFIYRPKAGDYPKNPEVFDIPVPLPSTFPLLCLAGVLISVFGRKRGTQ